MLETPVITDASPPIRMRLPVRGRWFVMQGGDTENVNAHQQLAAQRFGVDLVKVDGDTGRELMRAGVGPAARNQDFFSWGEPVVAPVAGVVVAIAADQPDNPPGHKDALRPLGNHVVIETDRGYVFLAHLQTGSVVVAPGSRVQVGNPVGRCGNSGNSDYPHLHLHVQDAREFNTGSGQNAVFGPMHVELTGQLFAGVEWPLIRGLFVQDAEA